MKGVRVDRDHVPAAGERHLGLPPAEGRGEDPWVAERHRVGPERSGRSQRGAADRDRECRGGHRRTRDRPVVEGGLRGAWEEARLRVVADALQVARSEEQLRSVFKRVWHGRAGVLGGGRSAEVEHDGARRDLAVELRGAAGEEAERR
jgi:hypothetical protein